MLVTTKSATTRKVTSSEARRTKPGSSKDFPGVTGYDPYTGKGLGLGHRLCSMVRARKVPISIRQQAML